MSIKHIPPHPSPNNAPGTPEEWFAQGVVLTVTQCFSDAERCFRQVLSLLPDSLEALLNLGYVLDQQGRYEEALRFYESVLSNSPQNVKARYNRAAHLLRAGDYVNGFADYEYRFAAIPGTDDRVYSQPRWDGSALHGRSILVYCEQGLGDALMFARYLPLLADSGARVVLEVQEPLVSLLQGMPGVEQVVAKISSPPRTDCYIPLLSLPYLFHTTLDSIPQQVPYLEPSFELMATWRERISVLPDETTVGLVWSGKKHPYPNRSCPPDYLTPLVFLPKVRFYSLQVGEHTPLQREMLERVIDFSFNINDFSDTAAIIANLDLVITIDTAVAHLAGAMAKPVWVMLPYAADWRWMEKRNDSPWYPTMRLFRQPQEGDWASVISEVVCALSAEIEKRSMASAVDGHVQLEQALKALNCSRLAEAIEILSELAQQLPDEPAVWFNLGRAHELAGMPDAAENAFKRAAQLYPGSVDILLHLGKVLVQQRKLDDAFACCHALLQLQPDNPLVRYNLAFLQLRTGDYRAGFANFEARLSVDAFAIDPRHYRQPRWDGTPLNGKSILIFGEQGMGDVIQFCRYIPLVAERGGQVVLEVDPPLIPLLRGLSAIAQVVTKSQHPPLTDCYIQLLSLPYLFATVPETVPHQVPYLFPDSQKLEQWKQRLARDQFGFRIGLVWRGNPRNPLDQDRSCPLAELMPLLQVPGARFFSLQVGAGSDESANLAAEVELADFSHEFGGFDDTAAFIANLDLVVGVDTSVIHLTGALGVPVWIMLSYMADWRWIVEREDTPWYPTARLFWQPARGDWRSVVDHIQNELLQLLGQQQRPCEPEEVEEIEKKYQQGIQLKEAGDLEAAEQCFRQIVHADPSLPGAHHSLGVVLQMQGRLPESIECYENAIRLDPLFAKSHYNLATACLESGRYQDAIAAVRAAIQADSLDADAHWLLGMLLLQQGEFTSGWQEYEWRWKAKGFTSKIPELGRPLWSGEQLEGKTLLIHMEQGRGDMIQFIRYAPLVAAQGAHIIVCAEPDLVSLLETVDGVDMVLDRHGELPCFDFHVPVLDLPYRFKTELATIPSTVPYLKAPTSACARWGGRVAEAGGVLRIGLAWAGNKLPNPNRSCPVELFEPLLHLTGTVFFSLQVDRYAISPVIDQLVDYTGDIKDFSDTAALIETLDLVITVDTAVAHLAGALGKQVWTLLPYVADWRWLLGAASSPWYPTMRLFRQPQPGAWAAVVADVQQALLLLVDSLGYVNQSGIALLHSGDIAGAERLFAEESLRMPDEAEPYCNRGVALSMLGRQEAAISCYRAALQRRPDYMQALHNLGNSYIAVHKLTEARECFTRVLELSPDFIAAHLALGDIAKTQRDFVTAFYHYHAVQRLDQSSADALQGLAEVCQGEECYDDAINFYQQALSLAPDRLDTINLLGNACQCTERYDEAENWYRRALKADPGRPITLNNLGVVLIAQGALDEAIDTLHHLVEMHPEYAEGHWNLAVALLAAGRYQEGWPEFEWRFRKTNPVPQRAFSQPRWDGSSLEGKTILLHAEQGFGDTIQMVRYLPLVARQAARVVLECQVQALQRLLYSLDSTLEVVVAGDELPVFDCHLPLMSLPLVFDTTVETIPAQVPYLHAEPGDVAVWRQRFSKSDGFRVGVVWYAKQTQVLNRKRSCPLDQFFPLWQVPGICWYSLQIGPGSEQLADVPGDVLLDDLTSLLHDFADTAACMANLDLIITIDTAAAHLAGALGRPVWVVLPHVAEWRWLEQRSDSPWYPGMRLFRQPDFGDWGAVMEEVAVALRERVQGSRQRPSSNPQDSTRLRVGLAWCGRQDNPLNSKRSYPFSELVTLLDLPQIDFVSLQLPATGYDERLIDLTQHLHDFEDTAALMANLDLIITIDTSVAHLSAATGRPTWLLLAHVADWRWIEIDGVCPWYPGIELFRQPDFGDWGAVVREVKRRLLRLSGNPVPAEPEWTNSAATDERQRLEALLQEKRAEVESSQESPEVWLDAGAAAALLGRNEVACGYFRQALHHDPELVAAHLNLGYALLAQGRYQEGWQQLEWRLRRIPAGQLPPWPLLCQGELGSHPQGTTVLVHCEQGYGDTIQFCRFLPMLGDFGYRVLVSCQPALVTLLASVRNVEQIVPHGEPLPTCELQVLMLSLPSLFSTTLATLPYELPYLQPSVKKTADWKKLLEGRLQRAKKIVK